MQEEIDGMDRYTHGGLVDTFRHFYPDKPGRMFLVELWGQGKSQKRGMEN